MNRVAAAAMVVLVEGLVCASGWAQATPAGHLEFADKVRLVNCQPSTTRPGFRAQFNVVDAQGAPLSIEYPPAENLRGLTRIYVDNQELEPFFAVSQATRAEAVRGRVALILVDTSGSMNARMASGQTRFQTAQAALGRFFDTFDEKADRVAIVPFDSHDVERRIRSAQFARSKADALAAVSALPPPQTTNNTAIYSAVVTGLDVLTSQARAVAAPGTASPEMLLVLMTDGKNEVLRGDDPGLLDGAMGLQRAAEAVKASGIQVIGVGFGDPGSIDENAMRQVSTSLFLASNLDQLTQVFSVARTLLTNRIHATFASPFDYLSSLEGRTLRIRASLTLPNGQKFESTEQVWAAPQIGVPAYEGACETDELRTALALVPSGNYLMSLIRPVLVFAGLGTLLLVLWFWVPRLVWADQYVGRVPMKVTSRWDVAGARGGRQDQTPRRPAPPGFQTRNVKDAAPRGPSDMTRADFSKSRLQKRPDARDPV